MFIGVMIFNFDQIIEWINFYFQCYFGDKDVLGYCLEDIELILVVMLNVYLDEFVMICW